MKYADPQLRRALAAEYALGTLSGRPRKRFQRLLASDPALGAEVTYWENRLAVFGRGLAPVRPRPQVWLEIAKKIGGNATASVAPSPIVGRVEDAPKSANENRFWRTWAGLATAATVVLAVALGLRLQTITTPVAPPTTVAAKEASYVALVQMPNSTMHWTLSITPGHAQMTAAAGGEPPPLDGHSPELWWLSPQGPVALGVLPVSGGGSMPLPKGIGGGGEIKLAVSIEPAGGSPTGQPTGPVVVVTQAVKVA